MNFLCLLPMVLKTRGLGTGATFMRGSYVAEPRLLAWLRERTVLVKSEHDLNSTRIYREYLKLIFAFAAQSSLLKVRITNDNVRNAVPTRGTCRARTAASVLHTQTCSRNPLLRYRTLSQDLYQYYAQLHIDDAILCIINPRRACAARVTVLGLSFRPSVCLSVCLSVCYHVFCTTRNKAAKKRYQRVQYHTGLILKMAHFRKSTAFKSYGVKTKRTSQYANEHGSDSARFEHGGGSRSKTKGEYVVLACQKHYLLT